MFANNLKEIMERKKVKGIEVARAAGCSKAAISQYIHGINIPSRERAEAIAEVLGVSLEELLAEGQAGTLPCEGTAIAQQYAAKSTLTCEEAAALLHKHANFVRKGLREGRPGFEYGSAVKTSGRWSYCIYANKFMEVTGINIPEGRERDC